MLSLLGILSGYSATGFTNKLTIPPLSQEEFLYSFEIKWSTTSDTQTGAAKDKIQSIHS